MWHISFGTLVVVGGDCFAVRIVDLLKYFCTQKLIEASGSIFSLSNVCLGYLELLIANEFLGCLDM